MSVEDRGGWPGRPTAVRSTAPGAGAGAASHRRRSPGRKHPILANTSRTLFLLIAVFCLVVNGVGWTLVHGLDKNVSSAGGLDVGHEVLDGAVDILLVGTDNRTDAQGNPLSASELAMLRTGNEVSENTDTILLIRIPQDGSSATALSIPRDTYVSTPELGKTKINGVYGGVKETYLTKAAATHADNSPTSNDQHDAVKAGRNALIAAVKNLTGVEVDHYAEIGLLGFVLLTDAVGGVPVCLNAAVDEPLSGARFHAGQQTVSGSDALSFVRQRHDLPAGDLDRIVRQQVFMSQLVKEILSAGTLTDPTKLNRLTQAARRSFIIDQGWDFVDFAMKLKDISGGNVKFETIPVTSIDGVGENGESVVTVNPTQVKSFVRSLASGSDRQSHSTPTSPSPVPAANAATVNVEVVNATTRNGLAASVATVLSNAGYTRSIVSTLLEGAFTSHVSAPTAGDPASFAVAKALGGLPVQVDPAIAEGAVRVVLAEDYAGPSALATTAISADPSLDYSTPTEPLPPSIAKRPTFDAGSASVPCIN